MLTPLRTAKSDLWTALSSIGAVALICVFLNAVTLRVVWLVVGGRASTRTLFTIAAYYNGFALVTVAIAEIISTGVFKIVDPQLYASMNEARLKNEPLPAVPVSDWVLGVPTLLHGLFLVVWAVIAWGAFREVNRSSKLRSVIAFILSGILDVPTLALAGLVGMALRAS